MVILNQIVGIGGFSIADNLRLIVIAAIFVGIIVVLLYIRFARSGEKASGKYVSEEKDSEDIGDLEDIVESKEETAEEPVAYSETIEEKIKNSETEIIAKFAEVIKDIKARIDSKLTAEIEDIRAEFTAKIEEREKGVVNKIENVIDAKVQDALNKMNDRIGVALHTQKSSTASVLEKLVDSLRTEDASVGSLTSEKAEEIEPEASVKDQDILGDLGTSLQINEGSDSASFSDKSTAVDEDVVKPEEI